MYIDEARGRAKLVIVTDSRLPSDEAQGSNSVLRRAVDVEQALERQYYRNDVTRIALFEHSDNPTTDDRLREREALHNWLALYRPRVVVVVPTANVDEAGETQQSATICWHVFNAPDSLGNMRGCFYEPQGALSGIQVVPVFPRSPWLKQLQRWQQHQWLRRAKCVVEGFTGVVRPCALITEADECTLPAFAAMTNRTIAVDIESIEGTEKITAIGVSDGVHSVSVPWDAFRPQGWDHDEPSLGERPYGSFIRGSLSWLLADEHTAKVFHNHTFDVPRLAQAGLHVNGPIHDTFVASGVAYPELRHGLQHAVARELAAPPWKSIWHPRLKGVTRDDIEFWTCDPVELRLYNARDAFYTYRLAASLLPKVGIEL